MRWMLFLLIGVFAACSAPLDTPAVTIAPTPIALSTSTSPAVAAATSTLVPSPSATPTLLATSEPTHQLVEMPTKFDEKGLLYEYLDGNTPRVVEPLISEASVSQIAFNGDGSVWFLTDQGVSRVVNDRITHFADERMAIQVAFPWTGIQTLWAVAPDGTLWTTIDGELIGYNGKTWASVTLERAAVETVDHVAAGPDGLLAVTSASGLSVYTPEAGWQVPPLPKGISRDLWIGNDLLAGADGSMWIGLDAFGTGALLRYMPASQTWIVYDGKDGDLPQISVTGLALNTSGDVWVANDTKGVLAVWRVKLDVWEYLTHVSPFPDIYGFGQMYFSAHGDLWLPTIGHCGEQGDPCWLGLAHYADGIWKRYTAVDGLASEHIFAVAVEPSGNPWLITDVGIQRFQPK